MWVLVNLKISWYFIWLCEAVYNICLPSPLQDMFGNTFTAMILQDILGLALEKLGYHWYEGAHHLPGKACTRLLLKFHLPRLLPWNQCSPSSANHFLVDVKQWTTHWSLLWFLLTKGWATRLAMLITMSSTSCLRTICLRWWCDIELWNNY